jgi:predicted ATPase
MRRALRGAAGLALRHGTAPRHSSTAVASVAERYAALLDAGVLAPDAGQARCVARLQRLAEELAQYGADVEAWKRACADYDATWQRAAAQAALEEERRVPASGGGSAGGGGGVLSWVTASWQAVGRSAAAAAADGAARAVQARARAEQRATRALGPPPPPPAPPRGVYLHGSVGSGKTMLADMLYSFAADAQLVPLRRRLHCNAALLELHSRMAVAERERAARRRAAAGDGAAAGGDAGGVVEGALRLLGMRDPAAAQQRASRQARIAQRRLTRYRLGVTADEFSKALAASNSSVLMHAARALLRDGSGGGGGGGGDAPAPGPAARLAARHGAALLCFDEMQTNDPYNVAALKALTEAALADGGVLLATSNRPPGALARHGLHEELFAHFVGALRGGCDVVELSSARDYRRAGAASGDGRGGGGGGGAPAVYFQPLGPAADAALEAAWAALPPGAGAAGEDAPARVPVLFGRTLHVGRRRGGAAWFAFADLCARPLGPADYVALAAAFHTVFIAGVPPLSRRARDQARRFITLVDELYNARVRLVCSAAAPPDGLFAGDEGAGAGESLVDLEGLQFEGEAEGASLRRDAGAHGGVAPLEATPARRAALGGDEERFAFARAVSRLHEMQGAAWAAGRGEGGEGGRPPRRGGVGLALQWHDSML